MNLLSLDINATRARALRGPSPREARPLPLEREHTSLAMALNLEGRSVVVGQTGRDICRRSPHLACVNFLPYLSTKKKWRAVKQQIDADRALGMVFDQVVARGGRPTGTVVSIPAYFEEPQLQAVYHLAKKSKLQLLGSIEHPLAAALAAHREQPWHGTSLVVDVDEHALTWAVVTVQGGEARLLARQSIPELGERTWRERLLSLVADRCVNQSRRDPRHSASAEQSLYDQIEEILEAAREGRQLEVAVQSEGWYQNVFIAPEHSAHGCARLAQRAMAEMQNILSSVAQFGSVGAVVMTADAARLPGLVRLLEGCIREWNDELEDSVADEDDFGEQLLEDVSIPGITLHVMGPDAVGQVAHELAGHFHRGTLQSGHLEVAPLLDERPVDRGAARLQFRGRDYVLQGEVFSLGRAKDCDIVLESEQFPSVSGRHCEILQDQGSYILHDLSRNGTLVNDRMLEHAVILQPGDWIRLGPTGPLLRFLGHRQQRQMISRA